MVALIFVEMNTSLPPHPLRTGWLLPILLTVFLFTACQPPSSEPASASLTPTAPPVSAEASPSSPDSIATVPPNPTDIPTFTPVPLPTVSPTPTLIPTPAYTIMGVELVGSNFIDKVPLTAADGSGWVRWNAVFWSDVESQEGIFTWERMASFEAKAEAVSAEGMRLITIVRSTPAWAQAVPGYFCGPIRQDKFTAFASFMHELVTRYSQPPYNVKYWELGNEPDIATHLSVPDNIYGCWGDAQDEYYGGGTYAEMLKVVYPQIKAADPEAQVLVGGLLLDCDPNNPPVEANGRPKDCTPSRFLEGILRADGGDYFDGVSFHAYDYYFPTSDSFGNGNWQSGGRQNRIPVAGKKAQYLRSILALFGHPEKYLLNTETALICGRDQNEPECRTEAFELTKAAYVTQSYASALTEGLTANIWYHYQEGWRFSGLATGGLQPRPALLAYRFAAQKLDKLIFWGGVGEFEGVTGYKFIQPGSETPRQLWVIWALGDPRTIELTASVMIFDMLGNPVKTESSLEIGSHPYYLEWVP